MRNNTTVNTVPCSAYDAINGVVYFRRMADKACLQAAGRLPEGYVPYLGDAADPTNFDSRCCRFFGIDYQAFTEKIQQGLKDEDLFSVVVKPKKPLTETQKHVWNAFLLKRGWRDESTEGLVAQLCDRALPDRSVPKEQAILTHVDFFDYDEGRPLKYPLSVHEALLPPVALPKRPLILPELRSPYERMAGVVHVPRMLDKIRLHQAGKLPEEWVKAKGVATYFDGLCCEFFEVTYDEVEARVLQGASDADILGFLQQQGQAKTAEDIKLFNTYLAKRGWRDQYTDRLHFRLGELNLPPNTVTTMFDFIDLDEGRPVDPHQIHIF